jgi:hypothetical protein
MRWTTIALDEFKNFVFVLNTFLSPMHIHSLIHHMSYLVYDKLSSLLMAHDND